MEVYESLSRAVLRRKYRRIDAGGSGFAVKRKRVKVAHLQQDGDARRRSAAHRLRLGCFHLRVLVPGSLMASLKTAWLKLMQQVATGKGKTFQHSGPKPVLMLPRKMPLRSSAGEVVNEAWFQQALRRSIAEGRLAI